MATKYDLVIYQGDTYSKVVPAYGDDGYPMILTADGTTLTNVYTAQAQLRRADADTDTSIDATFSCTVFPIGSRVQLALSAATTLGLVNGPYVYDLQVTHPTTSAVTTLAYGRATVQKEVTR